MSRSGASQWKRKTRLACAKPSPNATNDCASCSMSGSGSNRVEKAGRSTVIYFPKPDEQRGSETDWPSVFFESVLLELQRLGVFRDRADNVLRHPRWDISRDLELDFDARVHEGDEVLDNLICDLVSVA